MRILLHRCVMTALILAFLIACPVLPVRVHADEAPKAATSAGKCMMWKVSSGAATVYLVGSMHLATPEMYPLPKEIEAAFAGSDTLVVEVNINKLEPQKMLGLVMDRGMYKGDQTLSTSIKKETWEQVKDICEKSGLPAAGIEKMKPWLVGMTIGELEIQKLGLDPKLGIDQHFLGLADTGKKTIEELESAEFQIDVMAGFDAKVQEENLAATLADLQGLKQEMDSMKAAWIAGDEKEMNEVITRKDKEYPQTRVVTQKLLYDRNRPMADKIEGYLKGDKTVMVVVGCAHMVGDKGIVKLLRDDKYKVEQSSATRDAKSAK